MTQHDLLLFFSLFSWADKTIINVGKGYPRSGYS
jgi:hypothetical protein